MNDVDVRWPLFRAAPQQRHHQHGMASRLHPLGKRDCLPFGAIDTQSIRHKRDAPGFSSDENTARPVRPDVTADRVLVD
jgi:hypothetical protein